MAAKRGLVTSTVRVKAYEVMARAVEEGFRRGWVRAHKYVEKPEEAQIEEDVTNAILGEICEVFSFDEDA